MNDRAITEHQGGLSSVTIALIGWSWVYTHTPVCWLVDHDYIFHTYIFVQFHRLAPRPQQSCRTQPPPLLNHRSAAEEGRPACHASARTRDPAAAESGSTQEIREGSGSADDVVGQVCGRRDNVIGAPAGLRQNLRTNGDRYPDISTPRHLTPRHLDPLDISTLDASTTRHLECIVKHFASWIIQN